MMRKSDPAYVATLTENTQKYIEWLEAERDHFARVAWWFAINQLTTPVPTWCDLCWSGGEPLVTHEDIEASREWWESEGMTNERD